MLLALLHKLRNNNIIAVGVGVDISSDALDVARINALSLGFNTSTVCFSCCSFESFTLPLTLDDDDDNNNNNISSVDVSQAFDVVLCNPPYLDESKCKLDVVAKQLDPPPLTVY